MKNNWQKVKLGDICGYSRSRIPISEVNLHNYVSTENLLKERGGKIIAGKIPEQSNFYEYNKGCTLVSNIRPYFKKIWFADIRGGCSNDVLVYTPNKGINDKWLYYLLSQDSFFDFVMSGAKGTKMPRGDKSQIMKFSVALPPLDEQKKIAEILSALDDKIELNNKINRNLEAQAQAIFKSWFIDFEPFGGSRPKRWKIGNLLDIATYLNGISMQKYKPGKGISFLPVLKIRELRQGYCDKDSDICSTEIGNEFIIDDGDIVFSWSGTLLINIWCAGKCGLNQHLFKVFSKKYDKWFYYLWTKHYLTKFIHIASGKATTMGHIKREDLEKAKVLIPSKEEYLYLSRIMSPIINKMIQNRLESVNIVQLRNMLLPKLMSGEILIS